MEVALQTIETRLKAMQAQLDRIEAEVKRVSKHVPFVDDLADSGVVGAVQSLNSVFRRLNNPIPQLSDEETKE